MTESTTISDEARALHDSAIVIDATCPLANKRSEDGLSAPYLDWWIEGGATAIAPTVASREGAADGLRSVAFWRDLIARDDRLRLVTSAADVEQAKRDGTLGIILHFQGIGPIENDLNLVEVYKALGVGIIQLAYNIQSLAGAGCEVRDDEGLTPFGRALVERMNQHRVIVDCSHTGRRTTLEAIAHSRAPTVFSHANPFAVRPSGRAATDEQIRAVAATGGLTGIVGFPAFVSQGARPTLDQFIDHIAYVADLVGIEHVALGIDYFTGQVGVVDDDTAARGYRQWVDAGIWDPDNYPPPPYHYPEGIDTPRTLQNITARLLERGFTPADCRKVLGENWLRVYRAVWGA
ncbi:MAG TPA: membrane dipeptidase [Thermomicrobiales bacterium]|nr:membrane dipeptidase [Thermomicrobiales bacterium]